MAKIISRMMMIILLITVLCACTRANPMEKKVRDLDFTVVGAQDISEELQTHIDERKEEAFTLIYRDGENMYLIIGYGRQSGGGYSIQVNDLYLGENAICVSTSLEGPDVSDETTNDQNATTASFPYIVIKIETMDAPVIFDI